MDNTLCITVIFYILILLIYPSPLRARIRTFYLFFIMQNDHIKCIHLNSNINILINLYINILLKLKVLRGGGGQKEAKTDSLNHKNTFYNN